MIPLNLDVRDAGIIAFPQKERFPRAECRYRRRIQEVSARRNGLIENDTIANRFRAMDFCVRSRDRGKRAQPGLHDRGGRVGRRSGP